MSVTDDELKESIEALIPRVDIESTGFKKFMKLLAKRLGHENADQLQSRKKFIKETLTDAIHRLAEAASDDDDDDDDEADDQASSSDDEAPATPKRKKTKGGGLAKAQEISPSLARLLGRGKSMARTDVVKSLWEYIREHDLQNPSNRREIILDPAMKQVFGCDRFTMFSMNKYVSAHIYPFKPVDLSSSSSSTPSRKKRSSTTSSGGSATKKRKTGSQPPYRLSDDLAAVVGKSVLPRPQVVKAIWEYIRAHDLQNPKDKRQILCDAKLATVMKCKKVSMFKMNQCITPHLIEKVDKSEYQHEEEGDKDDGDDDGSQSDDE